MARQLIIKAIHIVKKTHYCKTKKEIEPIRMLTPFLHFVMARSICTHSLIIVECFSPSTSLTSCAMEGKTVVFSV
jgi:hypothetical protein